MIDIGENILATVGIDHALARRQTAVRRRGLARPMENEIRSHVRTFMGTTFADMPQTPPLDYEKALSQLSDAKPPEASPVEDLPAGDVTAYFSCVRRASEFLNSILPRAFQYTKTGIYNLAPGDVEVADFRRAWAVGCDPMMCLRWLAAGMITPGAVIALQAMFPSIYAAALSAVDEEKITRLARDPKWRLIGPRDDQLAQFVNQRPATPGLAAQLQQAFTADNEKTPSDDGRAPPRTKNPAETQVQRVANS